MYISIGLGQVSYAVLLSNIASANIRKIMNILNLLLHNFILFNIPTLHIVYKMTHISLHLGRKSTAFDVSFRNIHLSFRDFDAIFSCLGTACFSIVFAPLREKKNSPEEKKIFARIVTIVTIGQLIFYRPR